MEKPQLGDCMVEVTLADLDEGRLIDTMNIELRKAYRALREHQDRGGNKGDTAKISLSIVIGADTRTESMWEIVAGISSTYPKRSVLSLVKEAGSKLLCQPAGANRTTPDQLALFSPRGTLVGRLDRATGEVLPPESAGEKKDVAGRVGAAG